MSSLVELPTVQPPAPPRPASHADAEALAAKLRRRIAGEVRFDQGSRALYAADLSMYRQVPIGVVIPRTIEDVIETVAACRRYGAPILGRGCGTSLSGQCCNVAVILDFSKYLNRILDLDPDTRTAWVEPGVICDQLRSAAEEHQLTFAPDPATHAYCTLGGMIGNNSCGAHSVMGGKTVDNVEELDVLTYDGLRLRVGRTDDDQRESIIAAGGRRGAIYHGLRELRDRYATLVRERYPKIPRRVSGYNLDDLLPEKGFHVARALVGSESTCVLVLRAKLRLVPNPQHRSLLVIGYPDTFLAADHVMAISAFQPIALEAFHEHVLENLERKGRPAPGGKLLPEGHCWLLVEFGGQDREEVRDKARQAMAHIESHGGKQMGMKVFDDPAEQKAIWKVRESGVGASRIPGVEDAWPSWEDAAVPPEKLGDYLRDFVKLLKRYGYAFTLFGHFGQGCVHARITFHPKTAEGVAQYRKFMYEAADLVVAYGGSLSGEHGDGQAKGELLPKMYGPGLMEAFREFKRIWDPEWKMNPGKLIDAYPLTSNLRVGPDYHPRPVMTYFQFPDDHGSMSQAVERCFGVGKCRQLTDGTMCPSFMATREEKYTTRGRAHLLFEMLRGDAIRDGWKDEAVKDSLDLCLACKGCKHDCPEAVDLATYKAEFLAHYYEGRPWPLHAYALGLIFRWARLASFAPRLANFFTQTPLVADAAKWLVGVTAERRLPPFARQTFQSWFCARPPRNLGRPAVILWPDTFNNYFHPHTAQAAVEVLEAAGRRVIVPQTPLCCGRPLYDFGMLDRAKAQLRDILTVLRPAIQAGVPVVGLEPSCVAVFRDEMLNLFPNDEDARRLHQQTYFLSEYLNRQQGYHPPRLERQAVVHGHCHHKSLLGMEDEKKLLQAMGLDVQAPDDGCCGLAGSFGYGRDHYDVSMKVGERVLLPAVRAAPKEALIIADGFSCRSQIEHGTDRRALHLAEVLQLAAREGTALAHDYPETGHVEEPPRPLSKKAVVAGLAVGGLLAAGGIWWLRRKRAMRW